MSRLVIFPARSSYVNVQHGMDKKASLFEVYSPIDLGLKDAFLIENLMIVGDEFFHYIVNMNINDLTDIIANSGYYPGNERYLSEAVFSKIKRKMDIPKLMGIVNVTPDSFYPGSRIGENFTDVLDSIIDQKPDVIDIGGESTRPGSDAIDPREEKKRIRPVLEYVRGATNIPVSIDSRNPETIEALLDLGFEYINDISGFVRPEMGRIAAENNLKCIAMHMKGTPKDMQNYIHYEDMIFEINRYFLERTSGLISMGVNAGNIIIDPGIGFSKDLEGNLQILSNLQSFNLGFGTLVGASRKGFIGKITGDDVSNRLPGTIATSIYLMNKKADILRVHDVKENRSALKMYKSIMDKNEVEN